MWKKKVSLMLAAALVLTAQPMMASANIVPLDTAVDWLQSLSTHGIGTRKGAAQDVADTKLNNGTKGSFTWSFQAADGTLTINGLKSISGNSLLPDYTESSAQDAPWICQATDMGKGIKRIVFKGTIQAIGTYNFYGYSGLEEVDCSQAASLTTLGKNAFANSGAAKGIRFLGLDNITLIGDECFAGSTLAEITMSGITVLPARVFQGCENLKTVVMPNLEQMGEGCFSDCTSMTEGPNLSGYKGSTLPASTFSGATALSSVPGLAENTVITSLGKSCFANTALTELTLPVKIKTLESSAFSGSKLEELPDRIDQVTSVGSGCFSRTNLTEVTIPKSITITGRDWHIFGSCKNLKAVTIEDGSQWTTLPQSMFSGCTMLEQVIFPENCSITTVSSSAFGDCTSLTEFTFPSSVTKVEEKVFYMDSNLQQVSFPADTLSSLDWSAFEGCTSLQQILFYGSKLSFTGKLPYNFKPDIYVSSTELQESLRKTLASYREYAGDEEKPEEQQKIKILTEADKNRKTAQLAIELTEKSLKQEDIVKGAVFEPQVTKNTTDRQDIQYCYYTDSACTSLFDPENPYKVPDKVGIYYMRGYLAQDSAWFPAWSNAVTCRVEGLLEEEFYSYDTYSKKLVIKATLDQMLAEQESDTQAAADAEEKNFTKAGQQPWSIYADEIQTVEWASGVDETRIGDYMFAGHRALTQVTLPEGITKLGAYAFQSCGKIETLNLPAGVKSLGEYSLSGINMQELVLPAGLETIGASAFEGAHIIAALEIPASVTKLGTAAFQRFRGSGIVFPDALKYTEIPDFCFANMDLSDGGEQCGNRQIFHIPNKITRLGESAFMGAKLSRIEVPASVTRIEKSAFQNCDKLQQIALLNKEYTGANISQSTVVVNYYTVNSVFAGTPEECMICCDGLTYDLLGDVDSYNYGRKLYSVSLMEKSLQEVKNACDAMKGADYPEAAWAVFETAYTQIREETEAEFSSVLDKVLVLQQAEEKVITAAATVLQASVNEAGTLEEDAYTADSWLDFFYAYDELSAYFEIYGLNIEKEDLSYLIEVNAEMAEYQKLLKPSQSPGASGSPSPSPTPGASGSPSPGASGSPSPGASGSPSPSPLPGASGSPAPGASGSPAPGTQNSPTPGTQNSPAPGIQGTPVAKPPVQQPGGNTIVKLKKPTVKKLISTKKKKVTVQWKKVANASGYQIAYGYKKNMKGAKTVTVKKAATVKKTISGLKRKKTCYVRIRAWAKVSGKKVYSSWSTVKKTKVK